MDKQVDIVASRGRERVWEKGKVVRSSQFGEGRWLWFADKRLSFSAPPDRMGKPCLLPH